MWCVWAEAYFPCIIIWLWQRRLGLGWVVVPYLEVPWVTTTTTTTTSGTRGWGWDSSSLPVDTDEYYHIMCPVAVT